MRSPAVDHMHGEVIRTLPPAKTSTQTSKPKTNSTECCASPPGPLTSALGQTVTICTGLRSCAGATVTTFSQARPGHP